MDLRFSEMSVDTSLAQEYLKKNETLLELYNDYNGTIGKFSTYFYDGKEFIKNKTLKMHDEGLLPKGRQNTLLNMASKLKQNATLIMQLEYYIRNIPIEDTRAQLNLIIKYIRCHPATPDTYCKMFYPDEPLLVLGHHILWLCGGLRLVSKSKKTAAICHLLVTLLHEAGAKSAAMKFVQTTECGYYRSPSITCPVQELDSGTVAVVSDDADVDSAVDKFITVSMQAPWRLRRILVQESVYQQFKDALSWKCNLNKSGSKTLTSDVLCADTLTYNDRIFLIDPVELTEETPSVVIVEAYRTTKEMISLVHQHKARYLSLWTNGIAEINEVVHSTKSPVVWVNNVADFRGPPQVAEAVFSYYEEGFHYPMTKCAKVAKLCELAQSWLKLDLESRREILYGLLDKYILLYPENKDYSDIRNSLSACTLKSFVDVGKDYVCTGISRPLGILDLKTFPSVKSFELLLQGNAFIYITDAGQPLPPVLLVLEQEAGLPFASVELVPFVIKKDEEECDDVQVWNSSYSSPSRVVWTNSGTIFAN